MDTSHALGLSPLEVDLLAHQHAVYLDELDLLAEDGVVQPVAAPDLPGPFLGLLARALRVENDVARHDLLRHYHLDFLPRRRVVVLAGRALPLEDSALTGLFSTPLRLAEMPSLRAALGHLDELIAPYAAPMTARVDGHTFAEVFATCFYGRYAAPLGTSDQELAALVHEGLSPIQALDLRLAGPLLHELTHLAPTPLLPPYLDECIAAALGARAMPALISPVEADHNAMVGAGWFVQVGEHLFLAFGFEAILSAHLGVKPWAEVLPAGLPELFEELGWQQYLVSRHPAFLGEAQRPDPWIKLIHLARLGALDRLAQAVSEGGIALYQALEHMGWSDIASPPLDGPEMAIALERAFMARPLLGVCGQWRVERACVPRTWDHNGLAFVAPCDTTGLEFRWVLGPVRVS